MKKKEILSAGWRGRCRWSRGWEASLTDLWDLTLGWVLELVVLRALKLGYLLFLFLFKHMEYRGKKFKVVAFFLFGGLGSR